MPKGSSDTTTNTTRSTRKGRSGFATYTSSGGAGTRSGNRAAMRGLTIAGKKKKRKKKTNG